MLRTQDFIAPVGGGLTVQIKANYIKYLSGSAGGLSTRIRIRSDRGGADLTMEPGDSVKLPQEVAQFTVENADGEAAISGVLIAGMGEFSSDRVIGTVAVIDVAKDRTMAGVSFLANIYMGPVAAEYSAVQLWNPPGSGVRALVRSFKFASDIAGAYGLRIVNFQLANLQAMAGLSANPLNKRSGGAVSSLENRVETVAALWNDVQAMGGQFQANSDTEMFRLVEPIVIDPGYGLLATCHQVNAKLFGTFDLSEEVVQ